MNDIIQGHQCKPKSLQLMTGEYEKGENSGAAQVVDEAQEESPVVEEGAEVTAEVSLNILMGLNSLDSSPSTIKILGRVKRIPLVILIDCGSTHSFIDPNVPKKLGLLGEPMKRAMHVNVASRYEMVYTYLNPSFVWEMNDIPFTFNLHWLKVPGCDII